MKNLLTTLLALVACLACLAYISVPTQQVMLAEYRNHTGIGALSQLVYNDFTTSYENKIVYSCLKDIDGNTIAWGVFGNVIFVES